MNGGNELKKTFRTDPGPPLEDPLEMVFTQADLAGDFPKRRLAPKIIFYEKYSAFDALVITLQIFHRAPPVVIITDDGRRCNPILAVEIHGQVRTSAVPCIMGCQKEYYLLIISRNIRWL